MLSFERVLEAFREHLTEDTGVEVVPTPARLYLSHMG